jgi:hypothetical protein
VTRADVGQMRRTDALSLVLGVILLAVAPSAAAIYGGWLG